jgi:hypothetical protein
VCAIRRGSRCCRAPLVDLALKSKQPDARGCSILATVEPAACGVDLNEIVLNESFIARPLAAEVAVRS